MRRSLNKKEVIVFDTSAFLSGFNLLINNVIYTVPEVIDEIKDEESRRKLEYSIEIGKIAVISPDKSYDFLISNIKNSEKLSKADKKLISLALFFKEKGLEVVVFTDDYKIQEVLKVNGIKYRPIKYRGIK